MKERHHRLQESRLGLGDLERYLQGWLLDCEIRMLSPLTVSDRRLKVEKLFWFLRQQEYDGCGIDELREFFAYLTRGHTGPSGRWNTQRAGKPRFVKPPRPRTTHTYHDRLRTFFNWMVEEGVIPCSPMERIPPPVSRTDQIQPFTELELQRLRNATKRSSHPRRDEFVVLVLLDTGMRSAELANARVSDVDFSGRSIRILGKGRKERTVYYSRATARALWHYLDDTKRPDSGPLVMADRGPAAGTAMTPNGILQLVRRLGRNAEITRTRCSPHTFRHTFAVSFLRAGGNQFTLMQILGHTHPRMTQNYVAFAQADIEKQQKMFSPVEALWGRDRKR